MSSLTDTGENRALDWLTGNTVTAPVLPLQVALVTVIGSDAAAGTEVVGGSYARQSVTFTASAGGATSNSGTLTWSNMPACTVVGVDVFDSAGSPVRWWWAPLSVNRTVAAGDSFSIPAGSLTLGMT